MVRLPGWGNKRAFTLLELLVVIAIIAILIGIIFWCSGCGGKPDSKAEPEKSAQDKEARARQAAAQIINEESEVDADLRKFAKEFVPDLQQAIDRYDEQIKQFTEQRAVFARDMAKLGVDPEKRPAYNQKKQIIEKMTEDAKKLVADRKETYIRWKELNLLRDTAETKEQRDKLLQSAQKAAKSAEETFDKYMKQSLDADAK